jgi:glyoxylase-like metal-dependent hydrolase (beta-lactamase superfamily II)
MKRIVFAAAFLASTLLAIGASAQQKPQTGNRLYVMDCGQGHAPDKARWSPGVEVGKPWDISDNCYLIRHGRDYLLWDTGITDSLQPGPAGQTSPIAWSKPKKLIQQLAGIGVTPDDIKYIAVSHSHPDHIGNVDLFPKSQLLMQKAEWDFAFADNKKPFSGEHPVKKLESDYDVFGDGSVEILQTPGHTPGHQLLMVKLQKTGWLMLSGDAVHFKSNWDNRRIPAGNTDKQATLISMQRMAAVLDARRAKLWINHDKAQSNTLKHAPDFYE